MATMNSRNYLYSIARASKSLLSQERLELFELSRRFICTTLLETPSQSIVSSRASVNVHYAHLFVYHFTSYVPVRSRTQNCPSIYSAEEF